MSGILLWVILAAMTLGVIAALVIPLLRERPAGWRRADFDRQIYRDQLRELDADVARAVITAAEADAARVEIQRRLISTDDSGHDDGGAEVPARAGARRAVAIGVAVLVPVVGLSIYIWLGNPGAPTAPPLRPQPPIPAGAQRTEPPPAQTTQIQPRGEMPPNELDANIERLRQHLDRQPGNLQGWMLLARSLTAVERYGEAAAAYQKAAAIDPDNTDVKTSAAEAMVMASGGRVTREAAAVFRDVLSLQPNDPASRYYIALGKAQAGEFRDAFDMWRSLLLDAPADAPWRQAVAQRVGELAAQLGLDIATAVPQATTDASAPQTAQPSGDEERRGPTAEDLEAAANMSPEERQQFIRGMVVGLAARLEEDPHDPQGWRRLVQVYGVLSEREKAFASMARAVAKLPDDVVALLSVAGALMQARRPGDPAPEAAVTAFRRVLEINPNNSSALFYLGQVQVEAGEVDQARATWQRLLGRLDPGSPSHTTVKHALERLESGG